MKINNLLIVLLTVFVISCKETQEKPKQETQKQEEPIVETIKFQNKGHELVYNMVEKVGTYQDFLDKKDVVYTYTYITPDGKTDISTEKYIFNGELSYGMYTQHERTFPEIEGVIEQGYDGYEYWLKNDKNEILKDEKLLKTVAFKRPTNFYWFAMFQKLVDPNLSYEYLGEKTIDTKTYNIVKVSFNTDKPTDIYQIYINQKTGLVDLFLFTVADFGKMDARIMKVEYEEIEGMLIPAKRKYKKSDWNAIDDDKPWITVNWTDIKFNNGLSVSDFKK